MKKGKLIGKIFAIALVFAMVGAMLGGLLGIDSGASPVYAQSLGSRTEIFTGQGFDTCEIPTLNQMLTWITYSPYDVVNLYIGGSCRACPNSALTASYVSQLSQQGWKFIPTWVGPQSACWSGSCGSSISSDPATAYNQGISEANAAIDVAINLGLASADGSGTIIYYDLEAYDTTNAACHDAAKSFISGWTAQIHTKGSLAGVYGYGPAINDFASIDNVPDAIWPAHWIYDSYNSGATVWDVYGLSNSLWMDHQRIRQYAGGATETYGGVTLNIDCNVIDGIVATIAPQPSIDLSLVSLHTQNFPFIYLTVRVSRDGQPVGNLTKENFSVTEDTRLQTDMFDVIPPQVGGGVRMADIVFLVDASGSMGNEIADVRGNCVAFANALAESDIDYRLGLVQFGNYYGANPGIIGGGLTDDAETFKGWVGMVGAYGGYQPGFAAIRLAIQSYNFRPGAQKVFILITDEDSDDRNKQDTINLILANDVIVHTAANCGFGTSQSDYCDIGSVREVSGGLLFPVTGNYTIILDTIQHEVANTYIVRYRTDNPVLDGIERTIVVTVDDGVSSGSVQCTYTPGGAPQIQRTQETLALHGQSLVAGSSPTISVNVTDAVEPFVQSVTLNVRVTDSDLGYTQLNMSPQGGDIYSAQVPGTYVETPGLDYYIRATDGQVTSSDPSTDPDQKPYQIAVLPNEAPVIEHTPPASWQTGTGVDLEIGATDSTYNIDSLTVYYRRQGELLWQSSTVTYAPATPTSVNETITLPVAGWNTPAIEYYIEVTDDLGISSRWPIGGADAPYLLEGHYEESVPIYTRPFQAVPIAEMTVTYSKSGEINGEPIYLVSKIQVITRGFTGICRPQIFNQNGQEIWSSYLEIKPGKPYIKEYDVHLLVHGSDAFGVSTLGFDLVNTLMRGIIKAKELYIEYADKLLPYLSLESAVKLIEKAKGLDEPIEAFKESSMFVSKSSSKQFYPESEVQKGGAIIPKAIAEYFKKGEFMKDWINVVEDAGLEIVRTARDGILWIGQEIKNFGAEIKSLLATYFSPGEFRVYDSQGRVTGLVNGKIKEEIPYSLYDAEEKTVIITNVLDSYRYEVVGTEEGSYGLELTSVKDGEATTFTASDIPITAGAIHDYTVDWDALSKGEEGVTIQIDSDGDGTFEDTFTSDDELTRDEFLEATAPPAPMVPTIDKWGIVAMITLFAGLLVWMVRRRRFAS